MGAIAPIDDQFHRQPPRPLPRADLGTTYRYPAPTASSASCAGVGSVTTRTLRAST